MKTAAGRAAGRIRPRRPTQHESAPLLLTWHRRPSPAELRRRVGEQQTLGFPTKTQLTTARRRGRRPVPAGDVSSGHTCRIAPSRPQIREAGVGQHPSFPWRVISKTIRFLFSLHSSSPIPSHRPPPRRRCNLTSTVAGYRGPRRTLILTSRCTTDPSTQQQAL